MAHPENVIPNEQVIPEIGSSLFVGHESSRFAVGIVGVGSEVMPGLESEFQGYALLRGNVYAKQQHFMPEDDLNADGTEADPDDARSVHFAVIENAIRSPRVVGGMRLIIKSRQDQNPQLFAEQDITDLGVSTEAPLPIEGHYPEAFVDDPAPLPSTESSRLISRHEVSKLQKSVKWMLFTAGVSYIMSHDLGPAYGAVEPFLSRALRIEGMPTTEIGEAKFVPEFNATKLPIRIDVMGLAQKIEGEQPGALGEARENLFVYNGEAPLVASDHVTAA
jgi:N-acyl-L-homoserine lactone synthetase